MGVKQLSSHIKGRKKIGGIWKQGAEENIWTYGETRGWRKLHNELNNLYTSSDIIMVIKSRKVCCEVHAAQMGEIRYAHSFGKKLKGKYNFDDLGIDVGIILKWILQIWCEYVDWIHLAQDRYQWQPLVNTVMHL
jgi:hypothetical protein